MNQFRKSVRYAVAAGTIVVASCGLAGVASAQPAVGSVGNADNKAPKGQTVGDKNKGYECDGNKGAGQGNPAHSHDCGPVVVIVTPTPTL